jgi:acetyl-CoA carboxylase carboxyltransferase component
MNIKTVWENKKQQALLGGGSQRQERQKQSGKLTARQRLEFLLDPQSFEEIDQLVTSNPNTNFTDGVVAGFGTINNQRVAIYAQDFTLRGGSIGIKHGQKICKIMDMAAKIGCPIIGILDSGGARIEEGILGLAGIGEVFLRNVRYSGVVPQISVVLGPCAAGAAYSPALTDFIFTTEKISHLFVTGPNVIAQALHQKINKEELGGTNVHAQNSGVTHVTAENEKQCFEKLKALLSYLPANYRTQSEAIEPAIPAKVDLEKIVPQDMNKAYDIKKIINAVFDAHSFFEIQEEFAANIVVGFARLDGNVVGIVANQPIIKAGTLDIDASCKAARFINFCDNFSIPIISLVDVPGYLPGVDQEHQGIIRHGSKLLYAYSRATVPKVSLILRKAYGGAYIVMGSKHLASDFNFAWPCAQIAVMGAKGAVAILHRKQMNSIEDENEKATLQKELETKYEAEFLNPFTATQHGYIDSVIEPNDTRKHLINALKISLDKVEFLPKKRHGNIPL